MARLFHATSIENVQSIKEKGLISKFDGVYLTDSMESACRWMAFRFKAMGKDLMAVIEVEVNESKLIEGSDHSPMMVQLFGVGRSLVSERNIPKSRIKKVHYFKIP
jgi:hypothetical protein